MLHMPERARESMTQTQRDALAAELAELEGPRREAIVEAIATARSFGDLSENFAYHDAKNEQGLLERRITIMRARLESAVIVEHNEEGPMTTKKQKARVAAAGSDKAKPTKKTSKVKKTSRGK